MTEDEWFKLGEDLLDKWEQVNRDFPLTNDHAEAFEYAWDLAWENRGALG